MRVFILGALCFVVSYATGSASSASANTSPPVALAQAPPGQCPSCNYPCVWIGVKALDQNYNDYCQFPMPNGTVCSGFTSGLNDGNYSMDF